MIAEKIENIRKNIPNHVCLVAVSKTKPVDLLREAYEAGQRDFGENKAQEVLEKYPLLPHDVRWHFIGHLQTNKVKQIIDKTFLIHSLDRISLFQELEKQAKKIGTKTDVLIQFHIAEEETKHGFSFEEALQFLNSDVFNTSQFINIKGVMGMATFTENKEQITREFKTLKAYFEKIKASHFSEKADFDTISMGMSGDYELAIACGSNMVRVGSAIFGTR